MLALQSKKFTQTLTRLPLTGYCFAQCSSKSSVNPVAPQNVMFVVLSLLLLQWQLLNVLQCPRRQLPNPNAPSLPRL